MINTQNGFNMTTRTSRVTFGYQTSNVMNVKKYKVFVKSPNAITDPANATGINVLVTGNINDESQKNFEVIIQSIGLRQMPVYLTNPAPVPDLQYFGSKTLKGEGFVWEFGVEGKDVFLNSNGPVGLLIDELDGIVLPNTVVLSTKGKDKNIEILEIKYDL